jgi:hypothetical protein
MPGPRAEIPPIPAPSIRVAETVGVLDGLGSAQAGRAGGFRSDLVQGTGDPPAATVEHVGVSCIKCIL